MTYQIPYDVNNVTMQSYGNITNNLDDGEYLIRSLGILQIITILLFTGLIVMAVK